MRLRISITEFAKFRLTIPEALVFIPSLDKVYIKYDFSTPGEPNTNLIRFFWKSQLIVELDELEWKNLFQFKDTGAMFELVIST